MKTGSRNLEAELEDYEEQLAGLNSYRKELKEMTAKHGTDSAEFETDLMEAEQNISYYEGAIAHLKEELNNPTQAPHTHAPRAQAPPPTQTGSDSILPRTPKQGLGSLIVSSVSFLAGALLGSKLKSRKKDASEKN